MIRLDQINLCNSLKWQKGRNRVTRVGSVWSDPGCRVWSLLRYSGLEGKQIIVDIFSPLQVLHGVLPFRWSLGKRTLYVIIDFRWNLVHRCNKPWSDFFHNACDITQNLTLLCCTKKGLWMPFLPYTTKVHSVDWIWIWLLCYLTVVAKSVQFGNIAKKLINIDFCHFIFLIERKHYSY